MALRAGFRADRAAVSQPRTARTSLVRIVHAAGKPTAVETPVNLSPEEQIELRVLLEENIKLRQAVTKSTNKLSAEQLDKLTLEYNNLMTLAERAGLSLVDGNLVKQLAPRAAPVASTSKAAAVGGSSTAAGARTGAVGTRVLDKPAAAPPTPTDVSGRAYAKDMASLSVELDATIEDDEEEESPAYAAGVAAAAFSKGRASQPQPQRFASRLGTPEQQAEAKKQAAVAAAAAAAPAAPAPAKPQQKAAAKPVAAAKPAVVAKPVPAVDPKVKAREAARKEVAAADANLAAVIRDREHWMIITVPEKPTAGEDCLVLFNRAQSPALKTRPRITLMHAFNRWELMPEPNKVDLMPAPLPKSEAMDFWACKVKVPVEAFELNFVFSDNESLFENNEGKDYMMPVEAGLTYDEWLDISTQWALEREIQRREAEKKAEEEAEKKRLEALAAAEVESAKRQAEELVANRFRMQEKAENLHKRDGRLLWEISPADPEAGSTVTLRYNRKASMMGHFPVKEGDHVTLLYGFNGWKGSGKVALERCEGPATAEPNDEWWEGSLHIPFEAVVMNFVFNVYEHYDNNNRQDYAAPVMLPAGETTKSWAAKLAEAIRQSEYEARVAREEEARRKQAIKDAKRKVAQDFVKAVERRKVRHVLYTEPEVVSAGDDVTIYYNPQDTVLNGRQNVFLMGGWNRWTHPRPFGPLQMEPPAPGETHFRATVQVPKDAYKMDFVFSDVAQGDGTYDNRGGFDYHLPIEGSITKEKPLHVVHISVEMAPIAKVGGLGDVVTALGRAVKEQGHLVEVIMPKYDFLNGSPILQGQMRFEAEFEWGGTRIYVTTAVVENLRVFFIEPKNNFFATQTVYGRYDDEVRFDFFCKASLEFLLKTGRQPDILHCHDWSTAHVANSYWNDYHAYGLWKPKVVFTIHNLNYGQKKISEAAFHCQRFTTVSPTYAFETGGHPSIAGQVHKFTGIRNGIDPELWSPEENQWLPRPYDAETVVEGKAAARKALRERLNLTSWNDKFIVGVVSRLTGQKGVPLIKHAAYRAVERGGQFVLLGSAPDPKIQADFDNMARTMGGQDAAFAFKYDEPLSHLIYAACDMIIVPSMFEPCGLTQMIAMRYGTVPIVRHTGGLRDTVFDVDFDKERAAWDVYGSSDWKRDALDATNGFAFTGTDGGALDYAMNRAIDAWYNDRAWFHSLQRRVMEQDWSWNRPALDYIELYYSAIKA